MLKRIFVKYHCSRGDDSSGMPTVQFQTIDVASKFCDIGSTCASNCLWAHRLVAVIQMVIRYNIDIRYQATIFGKIAEIVTKERL